VNDTNASFIQNQNSLIQSFQRLITIAQLTSRGPVRKSLGELMVGNVIGSGLSRDSPRDRQPKGVRLSPRRKSVDLCGEFRGCCQNHWLFQISPTNHALLTRENEDRLFGASGTNDSAALSLA
jgi:hypothetical protein